MMLERQIFRAFSIYNVYGMRSVFFACLFPPIFPIRLIWGNIINMVATIKAFKQRIFHGKAAAKKTQSIGGSNPTQIKWAKTDHVFLEKKVLQRYRRTIGDILLERGYIATDVLQDALKKAEKNGEKIGAYLIRNELVGEDELLDALSRVRHTQHVSARHLERYGLERFARQFDELLLRSLHALPLMPCDAVSYSQSATKAPTTCARPSAKRTGSTSRWCFSHALPFCEGWISCSATSR